jgi:pimeloyl-ACP methyl ester carboxylesterase
MGLGLLSRSAPGIAALWAERLFFTPPRRDRRDEPAGARRTTLRVDGRDVAVWAWGRGPAVVLVHGWGGWSGQLAGFVPTLVARGLTAVAFDAPGHGRSGGRRSSLPQFARALEAVASAVGPLHGVIAHSLGAAATAFAFARGLTAGRAVFVGPPTNPAEWVRSFMAATGASPEVMARVERRFERRFGIRWSELSVPAVAPRMDVPLLVVHDRGDEEVPFSHGAEIAAAWPGATLLATEGLGHRRILREPAIVDRAVAFVASGVEAAGAGAGDSAELRALEAELFDRAARRARIFAHA